jgi:periplasmic protein TonB
MHVETQLDPNYTAHAGPIKWFALSVLFHVALITFVGGTREIPKIPSLFVDLRHIQPEQPDPITTPGIVPEVVVEHEQPQAPAPESPKEIARPEPPKPTVDLPVPFDTYLNVDEVDVRAEPMNDVPLPYPYLAYAQGIRGVVRLTLFINEQGQLDRVDLVDATPKGYFEKAAVDTVSKLYFTPATRHGRAVKSQKTIEVVFDPSPDQEKLGPARPDSSATEK